MTKTQKFLDVFRGADFVLAFEFRCISLIRTQSQLAPALALTEVCIGGFGLGFGFDRRSRLSQAHGVGYDEQLPKRLLGI